MKQLPPGFRYSFSKIESFRHCPMAFYLTYVDSPGSDDELPGYYSQFGSLMHSLLEEYFKGELPDFLLADEWRRRYDDVVTVPPPPYPAGFGEKNYNAAVSYLENFHGFGYGFEVISVEKKFVLDIHGYKISGIADLVLRNRETGGIFVVDHKTKSDTSMKKDYDTYRKQLYLYAIWVKEEYGVWPEKLAFNMVKSGKLIEETFDNRMVDQTIEWLLSGIRDIEACSVFEDWPSCIPADEEREPYFCKQICGVNPSCDRYQEVRQISYQKWLEKKQLEEALLNGY